MYNDGSWNYSWMEPTEFKRIKNSLWNRLERSVDDNVFHKIVSMMKSVDTNESC